MSSQESYDLGYYFDINRNEIGERFTVKVTVTDVGGRSISQDVLITMDGDFAAPVFSAAPDATVTVLMKMKRNSIFGSRLQMIVHWIMSQLIFQV